MSMYDTTRFVSGLSEFGIKLTQKQVEQFIRYYEILVEWNKVMNLTAITDYDEVMLKHFTDSLSIVKVLSPSQDNTRVSIGMLRDASIRIADIGTGAGFPGIPIKILYPEVEVVLMDSLMKRVKFLNCVIDDLELHGVSAIHTRAEDAGHDDKYREQFDYVVSRAVSNLSTLCEYCLPLVKKQGYFVAYKSEQLYEELSNAKKAICILGGQIEKQEDFFLPQTDIKRSLLVIKKEKSVSAKYPRKSGLPLKEPLK